MAKCNSLPVPSASTAAPGSRYRSRARVFPGEVILSAPPTLRAAALLGVAAVSLVAIATLLVEIPDRVHGRGVLMPAAGIVEIRTATSGVLSNLRVTEGQAVAAGELLAELDRDIELPVNGSLAALRRQGLDRRGRLLVELDLQRQLELSHRRDSLSRERAGLVDAHRDAARQEAVLADALVIARERSDRHAALAARGGISAEQAAEVRQRLLDARLRLLEHRARMGDMTRRLAAVDGQQRELVARSQAASLEFDLERQQLDSERAELYGESAQGLTAPVAGTVLRIHASPGSTVGPGSPVFSIAPGIAPQEVWVYLPARQAAGLASNTVIELKVDALPYARYGTVSARVLDVSRIALRPGDPAAAVDLAEPSFELRAEIDRNDAADVLAALPGPGASFRTELVRDRVSLARWLLQAAAGS